MTQRGDEVPPPPPRPPAGNHPQTEEHIVSKKDEHQKCLFFTNMLNQRMCHSTIFFFLYLQNSISTKGGGTTIDTQLHKKTTGLLLSSYQHKKTFHIFFSCPQSVGVIRIGFATSKLKSNPINPNEWRWYDELQSTRASSGSSHTMGTISTDTQREDFLSKHFFISSI